MTSVPERRAEAERKSAPSRGWVGGGRGRIFATLPLATHLTLLVLWPIAWVAPLAEAGLLPFFGGTSLSVLGAVGALWEADPALSILVCALAVVAPYAKTLAGVALVLGRLGPWAAPWLAVLAKLSMADIFLVAIYIVAAKGVAVGYVETDWGLWLFTLCVALSLAASAAGAGRGAGSRGS